VKPFRPLLLSLDFERSGSTPTIDILNSMVHLGLQNLGRHMLLYGSDLLMTELRKASCPKEVFDCPRWLARYNSKPPSMPCDLWQFSQSLKIDGKGPYDASCLQGNVYADIPAFWRRQLI